MSIRVVLLSVVSLLGSPERDGPLDEEVGRQFNSYPDVFEKTAKLWTYVNASGISLHYS